MKITVIVFLMSCILSLPLVSHAASSGKGGLGISAGTGIPFLSQGGVNYYFNNKFGLYLGYNLLDISIASASVKLSMPEFVLQYHPFGGSFFLGAGVGQETLKTTATDITSNIEASIEVTAMAAIGKLGWMWGIDNQGFWFGIDASFISPSSPTKTITAPGLSATDTAYKDAEELPRALLARRF